jgi:DNA-binding response OmpR family regulator
MPPEEQPVALVIDGSADSVGELRGLLEAEGYLVEAARDGRRGIELARDRDPDLVVLDLALPDGNGVEVCRALRGFTDAYVIMVTARDREVDKVVGLAVGADDYVTKPFSRHELTARIRAMRRRPRGSTRRDTRDFGRLVVDVTAREVLLDGVEVRLTRTEFEILDHLSRRPRSAVSREQLLARTWGPWFGDDHVVEVHVAKLRRKLGESAARPGYVRTVRGVGYRFDPTSPVG